MINIKHENLALYWITETKTEDCMERNGKENVCYHLERQETSDNNKGTDKVQGCSYDD